jgi:hypothetical protein
VTDSGVLAECVSGFVFGLTFGVSRLGVRVGTRAYGVCVVMCFFILSISGVLSLFMPIPLPRLF